MSHSDKQWAVDYINPYSGPQPSDETGPGTHFGSVNNPAPTTTNNPYAPTIPTNTTGTSSTTNPFRRSSIQQQKPPAISHTRNISSSSNNAPTTLHPQPPKSMATATTHSRHGSADLSPGRRERFPSPAREAWPGEFQPRRSMEVALDPNHQGRPRRVSSLKERFPGDQSVRPLDMLKHDNKAANRSPHLRKQHLPGADTIDKLDAVGPRYHHDGPYDAALLARNTSYTSSPVAALEQSNREALKATPRESIRDSVVGHRPLDNVAIQPPGSKDEFNREYQYEEGTNMMLAGAEGGDYKRWDGIEYHDDDIKGKGEPSFSLDRALKQKRQLERKSDTHPAVGNDIELVERPRQASRDVSRHGSVSKGPGVEVTSAEGSGSKERYADWEQDRVRRSGSHRMSGELKRRIGSLRRKGGQGEGQ